jgi:hypothetical protein
MHSWKRGGKFWLWADCLLDVVGHQAQGRHGYSIDVRARTSREACTQMFIGVYSATGTAVCEEFYPRLTEDTVDGALSWGIRRSELLIDQTELFISPHRIRAHLTHASEDHCSSVELETGERESYLLASKNALAHYVQAKAALVSVMRDRNSDGLTIREYAQRLNAALDAWAFLPRQYLNSTRAESNAKTPEGASLFGGNLLVEKLEHDFLGVGFSEV